MSRFCYINEKNPFYGTGKRYAPHNPYAIFLKLELFTLIVVIFLFTTMFYPVFSNAKSNELAQSQQEQKNVLGAETVSVTPTPTIVPSPLPMQIPSGRDPVSPTESRGIGTTKSHSKNSYSIAIYGDSMIDTMGERLEYVEHSLKKLYPSVNFTLYNYGIGAENVEEGMGRWYSKFDYKDRHYDPIPEVKPDIIIIGSFAYNPFTPYNRDRHWIGLTKLVQLAKTVTPQVYMLAEITPLRSDFGKGPMGVNYDTDTAYTHSGWIVEQLENAVGLSKTLGIPLIDVFDASKSHSGLTNPSDGIHPSVSGHEFTADIIANTTQL